MKQFKDTISGGGPRTIQDRHASLREKARTAGKALASTNLPNTADENIESYLKGHRASYDNLLSEEMKKIPSNASHVAEIESRSSEERSARLLKSLEETKNKLKREQLELEELDPDDGRHISTFFIWLGIIIIAVGEAFLTYKSFGLLDIGNNLVQGVVLACITVLYIAIPKGLCWFYEEFTVGKRNKWLLYLLPIAILFAGYYGIGFMRSHFAQAQLAMDLNNDGSEIPTFVLTPWLFMSLNLLFLTAGYYLNHLLPTGTQTKNRKALEKREATISKLEVQVEKYETALSEIPDRDKNTQIRASQSNAGRRDLYIQVNALFKETCGAFIEANLSYRSDGHRPRCFDMPISDLEDHFNNQ